MSIARYRLSTRRTVLAVVAMVAACHRQASPSREARAYQPARSRTEVPEVGDIINDPFSIEPLPPEQPPSAPPLSPPPPPPPPKPLFERLRDEDGMVPGLPGFSLRRRPDARHCGGIAIVTKRATRVAKDDAPLAAVLAIEFPTGLKFDLNNKRRAEASTKRFKHFMKTFAETGEMALEYYDPVRAVDDAARVVVLARRAQVAARMASVFARAEIPLDVRTGEFKEDAIKAYCETLASVAEPLQERAEDAASLCAEKVASVPPGWWNEVCVSPG